MSTVDPETKRQTLVDWETARRDLREVTDRVALSPADRRDLLGAMDRCHVALAAWLVTTHTPTAD